MNSNRRDFIKKSSIAGAGLAFLPNFLNASNFNPSPGFAATYMGDYAAPKLDTVRCAFIGVGARGSGHATRTANIEGTEVVAICDLFLL